VKINSNGKSSHRRSLAVLTAASLMMFILFPAPAMAYIDPGTGSFIIQGIIALVVGAGVAVKMYWHRIKAFFTGKTVTIDEDDDDE
jgi:hypothetical protein